MLSRAKNAWILRKKSKTLESAWKQIRCLKVLESPWKVLEFKSSVCWNFAFNYSFKANICMHFTSTILAFSLLAYLTNSHCNLSPACIITVLVSTVQHTSVSHCSLNFAALRQGYGFFSIILVLENCKFRSLKVLEKSLNFFALRMLWTL